MPVPASAAGGLLNKGVEGRHERLKNEAVDRIAAPFSVNFWVEASMLATPHRTMHESKVQKPRGGIR